MAFNLQPMAADFPPVIQEILLDSQEGWLTGEEMLILFENRHLFPVSMFTVPEPGPINFNVSFSQSPNLLRKTIRNRNFFVNGGNAFVHYI